MGVVSRCLRLSVAAGTAAALVGCGGSVADDDTPLPTRPPQAVQSAFCQAVQANSDAVLALNTLTARGNVRPEELRTAADTLRRTSTDLVASAPSDVRTDAQRVVDTLNLQVNALVAAGGSSRPPTPEVAAQINSPEVVSARQRLNTSIQKSCGRAPSTR